METQKVGIREFREKMASFVITSSSPLAITRHGNTIGYFIPVRPKASEADWAAFLGASDRAKESLGDAGVTEDDIIDDFKIMKAEERAERTKTTGA